MIRLLTSLAASFLARRSHINRPTAHQRIVERTRLIRKELGLSDDSRLRA